MTAPLPAVSVVLPTHNRAPSLVEAARSVLAQQGVTLELIVVDDASSDDSVARLEALGDPRLRIVRLDQNVGAAAARNRGIALAEHAWIAFQDSDDRWQPDKLARQLARLAELPDAVAVYCAFERGGRRIPERPAPEGAIYERLVEGNVIGTPALVARAQTLRKLGGFDESLARLQDWELAIRLAEAGPIACVDAVLFEAGEVPGGISDGHSPRLAAAERQIVRKHEASIARLDPALLAHRYWHLGHIESMADQRSAARASFARAWQLRPSFRLALSRLIARSPSLYRWLYRHWDRQRG